MKIGIWINDGVLLTRGGAFMYQSKLIELIDNYKFHDELIISFITSDNSFKSSNKEVILIDPLTNYSIKPGINLNNIFNHLPILKQIVKRRIHSKNNRQVIKLTNHLKSQNVDIIYYLTQGGNAIPDYPFISTNWDIGHLSTYSFPEFFSTKSKANRYYWYNKGIYNALAVFVESESGKQELIKYTNLNPDRVKVVHMFPGEIANINVSRKSQNQTLNDNNLTSNQYFFYPAQFWPHKNHFNLIMAFKEFHNHYPDVKLVFTGSDIVGNLDYLKRIIRNENLSHCIYHLGFVGQDELYALYNNALALVMPTFLGPTNMPPLEAISLGCPVICSDLKGHREQLGNAAIYIDPLNPSDISEAMKSLMNDEHRKKMIENCKITYIDSHFRQEIAIKDIEKNFLEIKNYRQTWGVKNN